MELIALEGTCSMYELKDVSEPRMIKGTPKKVVGSMLSGTSYPEELYGSCKTVIYNTTRKTEGFTKDLEKLGFKKVHEYMGNQGKIVHTYLADGQVLLANNTDFQEDNDEDDYN